MEGAITGSFPSIHRQEIEVGEIKIYQVLAVTGSWYIVLGWSASRLQLPPLPKITILGEPGSN